jgi:hypothetical protein
MRAVETGGGYVIEPCADEKIAAIRALDGSIVVIQVEEEEPEEEGAEDGE